MNTFNYDEPVFRPPSEAASLILQPTIGCTWNKCAFCEMYTSKKFRAKPEKEILAEIESLDFLSDRLMKVFLGDGNPMVLSTKRLLAILNKLNEKFPKLRRISAYALPSDLIKKSKEELEEIREAGLSLIYVGIESGDDEVLRMINKGETQASTIEGLIKAKEAGIKSSVMVINGLGGRKYSRQHAMNSALLLNEVQPEYFSTLVLSFPFGVDRYKQRFEGDFIQMDIGELLAELEIILSNTELAETIFRSDHASNYLSLKGILSRDRDRLVEMLRHAINEPEAANLRPEWMRGL